MNKLFNSIVIYGTTNGIKSLVPFLMLPILTFHMSPSEFGILSLIETTILLLLPFIMLNINASTNVEYFKKDNIIEFKEYVLNSFMLSFLAFLLFTLIVYFFRIELSEFINIDLKWINLLTLFAFLRVISSVILVIFQASQKPFSYALFSISQTIIDFMISYYFVVVRNFDISGRLFGIYGSFFIFTIVAIYILYKMDYFKQNFTFKYTKEILSFGLPLIPHAISGVILAMSDRYFISHFIGNDEVGLYTVAYQVSAVMLLVSMSINQAWTPIFYRLLKSKENKRKIKSTISMLFLLFLFVSIAVYYLSDLIYYYFIELSFHPSKEYLIYLLIGFTFQSFYFLFTNYLFYYKKTFLLSMITMLGACMNIIMNYYFIKEYGTIGVAYATALTWIFYFIMVFFLALYIKSKNEIGDSIE